MVWLDMSENLQAIILVAASMGYDIAVRALNSPVGWWGWHFSGPEPLSIVQLIRAGNLSPEMAALLWMGMERSASLIVAANPPLAGKTTTLTALLSFAPPDSLAYFTKGQGETFDLPEERGQGTYILINELSDHLPVYTWGRYARRAFELMGQGYSMGSTMHADSPAEVLYQLQGELGIPAEHLARLTFIVTLHVALHSAEQRRVKEIFLIQRETEGYQVQSLAGWLPADDSFQVLGSEEQRKAFADWAGVSLQ
ncbi:MAG TPA: hypothetical protein VNL15_08225, partial [Dehalococcoidia bacterium]|nr:hypothetical protein [Dehalococcoidia bacterium]